MGRLTEDATLQIDAHGALVQGRGAGGNVSIALISNAGSTSEPALKRGGLLDLVCD